MPAKRYPNSEEIDLELVREVKKLDEENRLDLNKNFKPIDSLDFLNDLKFDEIIKIMDSLED